MSDEKTILSGPVADVQVALTATCGTWAQAPIKAIFQMAVTATRRSVGQGFPRNSLSTTHESQPEV